MTGELDAREKADLDTAYGVVERGRRPREYGPALSELEKGQKTRAKRRVLDVVDRGLMDLVSVYRDAIALGTGVPGTLVNEEIRGDVEKVARTSTPELNLRRIGWIFDAREQMLEFNVPVPLALESMMVALKVPEGARHAHATGHDGAREGLDDARGRGPGRARDAARRRRTGHLVPLRRLRRPGRPRTRRAPSPDADGRADARPGLVRSRRAPTWPRSTPRSWRGRGAAAASSARRLTVPVDYADPGGATIELEVLRVPADEPSERVGSLVVNPGGPGAPGTSLRRAGEPGLPVGADRPLRRRRLRPARHGRVRAGRLPLRRADGRVPPGRPGAGRQRGDRRGRRRARRLLGRVRGQHRGRRRRHRRPRHDDRGRARHGRAPGGAGRGRRSTTSAPPTAPSSARRTPTCSRTRSAGSSSTARSTSPSTRCRSASARPPASSGR